MSTASSSFSRSQLVNRSIAESTTLRCRTVKVSGLVEYGTSHWKITLYMIHSFVGCSSVKRDESQSQYARPDFWLLAFSNFVTFRSYV
jgi:hypothetical protein